MEIGSIYKNRFKILQQFSKECRAYKCYDIIKREFVVLKFRNFKKDVNFIYLEKKIYQDLQKYNLVIPKYLNYHSDYIKFELLGPSLADMNPPFSLKTVLMIAVQLISHLESLHKSGYIFNGVKPANFVLGSKLLNTQKGKIIYMLDFGLSQKMNPEGCIYTSSGNYDYMSLYQDHAGKIYPLNEFESLAYLFLNILTGALPWQKDDIVSVKKLQIKQYFFGYPQEFTTYCDYINSLPCNALVDYSYLKNMFDNLMRKHKYKFDYQYDWCAKPLNLSKFLKRSWKRTQKRCNKSFKSLINNVLKQKIKKSFVKQKQNF